MNGNIIKGASGIAEYGYTGARRLRDAIYENSKGAQKALQSLGLNDGENLNNIVTAVGTSAVAPIFIRYNPISKEDKETKGYTAMRQPISAVIALAFQIPIMTAYNKWIDGHATRLGVEEMDLSAKPPKSVLKPIALQDYKIYRRNTLKNGDTLMKKSEWVNQRVIDYQDDAFYSELSRLRKKMGNTKINDFDLVKPDDFKAAKKDIYRKVLTEDFKLAEADIAKIKELDDVKTNGKKILKLKNISYSDFVEKLDERAKELSIQRVNKKISESAKIKLETSKLFKSMSEKFAEAKAEIYSAIDPKAPNKKAALDAVETQIESVKKSIYDDTIASLETKLQSFEKGSINHTNYEAALKKLKRSGCIDKIKYHGLNITDVEQSVRIKEFLTAKINKSQVKLSDFKKISGIAVGLAILPITCGILNWAYPRIMERYFPELAAAKKAKTAVLYGDKVSLKGGK